MMRSPRHDHEREHEGRRVLIVDDNADTLEILEAQLHSILPEPFEIGIGIHRGVAFVGHVGSGRISDYTAVGAVVNVAARLQALATRNEVVASKAVYAEVPALVELRNERRETLRGFAHPFRIAELAPAVTRIARGENAGAG